MSVTFHRAQLVKVATEAIAAHEKAKAEYADAIGAYKTRHAAAHHETHREGIKKLRDYLTQSLKRGGPIMRSDARQAVFGTSTDLENLFYTGVDGYIVERNVTKPKGLLTPAELIETGALLKVLEAAQGDTVSANELKLLGLKNLGPVFIAAAGDVTPATTTTAAKRRR